MKPWFAALLLAAGGCSTKPAGNPSDGAAVYEAMCATCHGPDGKPPASMVARIGVRDLTAPELRARINPALVEHQVRAGSRTKLMPAFEGALSDTQIAAVSAFVASPQFLAPK